MALPTRHIIRKFFAQKIYNYSTEAAQKGAIVSVHSRDIIGPPNPVSNIRPITFHVPTNETSLEKEFRLKRQTVQNWHEEFWSKHNAAFVKERKAFEESRCNNGSCLGPDEMSVFYKSFLDKYWRTHLVYNYEWYKLNFKLLKLAFKVELQRHITKHFNK